MLSIFLAGLRPRPLGRKERPAPSEATLLYWSRIGEWIPTPSQSLASSQRDVSLLLNFLSITSLEPFRRSASGHLEDLRTDLPSGRKYFS